MYDRDHFSEYLKQLEPRRDTVIGNDVWIGDGATILPGARVGSGVIVGAGAVVRGVVPNYAIVSGNPAQIVKMRFTDFDIARIVDLAWWDWPIDAIEEAAPMLARSDIAALEALKAKISA
jgi:virginiamycin A acetyltransferase